MEGRSARGACVQAAVMFLAFSNPRWVVAQGLVVTCDFENDIDQYTQYYNLNGDWSAYTADDCKSLCCSDPTCTVWQFAAYPFGHQAQCNTGDSIDYGDSGGIQFQGEQVRGL
jgi:hypothetical protein